MATAVFPAVEPTSAVISRLQALREAVAADPALRGHGDTTVQRELVPVRRPNGGVEVRRFYWSARRVDPGAATGITARTLYYDGRTATARTYDFPDEPVLRWLRERDGPLRSHGDAASIQVLRYIPLRRVTFLLRGGCDLPARVIAKSKKGPGLLRATSVLTATHQAALRAGPDAPRVPRPLSLDRARHVLYLEELPGRPLDEVLTHVGVAEGMARLGVLHRRLQELPVRGLTKRRRTADWLSAAQVAAAQVGMLAPSCARQATELYDDLARTAPDDGEPLLFCQGDFVPSQILCDESGWSVLDLDDGHYADPLAEVAALFTSLPIEVSLPTQSVDLARQAYLDAYLRQAGARLDAARWRWYLAVADLGQLARRSVKGRSAPGDAQTVLDRIAALGRR